MHTKAMSLWSRNHSHIFNSWSFLLTIKSLLTLELFLSQKLQRTLSLSKTVHLQPSKLQTFDSLFTSLPKHIPSLLLKPLPLHINISKKGDYSVLYIFYDENMQTNFHKNFFIRPIARGRSSTWRTSQLSLRYLRSSSSKGGMTF